ncbi:hypothetical protein [Bordetella genomosp. 13]|uniref:hypothetical protein n=1 Tax=Bordetella genomosp. 13 TaxID=463040 RepID=UPI0011A916F5|nr:hypothetical protein [Bordetella genomosp. 13]
MASSIDKDSGRREASRSGEEHSESRPDEGRSQEKSSERSLNNRPVDPNSMASKVKIPPGADPEDVADPGRQTPGAPPVDNRSGSGGGRS